MEAIWDGVTRSETLGEGSVRVRQGLADAPKSYEWPHVIALLSELDSQGASRRTLSSR